MIAGSLPEAVQAYLDTLETRAPSPRLAARDWLGVFARWCQNRALDWTQLTLEDLEDYRRTLRWEPGRSGRLYAPATVVQALSQLRHFLRWARRADLLAHDPSERLVLGQVTHRQPLLTPGQLAELLHAPDPTRPIGQRDALLLELVTTLELGLTPCLALDLADVPRLPPLAHLESYLREGRPALVRDPRENALLLTQNGTRMAPVRAGQLPRQYARQLGWETTAVCLRMLARSFKTHQAGFSDGRFSL